MPERFVVIGGDAAGMTAAALARRRRTPDELDVVAFERGGFTSYSACGLPYYVAGEIEDVQQLVARTPEEHRAQGVEVHLHHDVVGIDIEARTVTVVDRGERAGRERVEPFDQLLIATGAIPTRPDLPGADARGVHGIQSITDGISLRDHVGAHERAVVVGGGYIGLEMAEAMKKRSMEVTIVERSRQPMPALDPDMGALVADAIRAMEITLHTETAVSGFDVDRDGHVRAVVTDNGTHPADIVVLGMGVHPNSALARDAGIAVGARGGVTVDRRQQTNVAGVWAAGDCVETFHRISQQPVTIALGTHANKQGRVAGINVTGGYAAFPGVIGTAVTKICDYEIGRTGLSERDAKAAGFEYESARVEGTTRASYYPGAEPITIKVLVERGTGRLLGAQIVGREGAAKRIDVMATAIWNGMLADDFVQVDLGYAPPLSPLWDPTLLAARTVAANLAG
jgi:NADPH-dependent 2,4-dienoyl-CoA reductase/sulfur reductase-like enzyme